MKRLLSFLFFKFLFLFLLLISSNVAARMFYVDLAGSNSSSANGSSSQPWATIMYAVTRATTAGDTIFIRPGTHTLSASSDLAVGVSLMGAGVSSVINVTVTADWNYGLYLVSGTVNTNGNQSISHLRFTGNNVTAYGALFIAARGNVLVHDCTFENFDDCAVTFDGQANGNTGRPSVWSRNNRFYNNIVTNCSKRQVGDWMSGSLQIGAQEGMHIYNNTITDNQRGPAQNGYCIKYYANGYNRDLKIYNNTLVKLPSVNDSYDWNFAIELWNWMGGVDIYNNHIEGSIDLDHISRGAYAYGTRIYNNYFGYSSLPTSSGNWTNLNAGLYIEFACSDVYIYNNEFHNLETPIRFSPRNETYDGIYIYYNLFHQIGNINRDNGCNLMNFAGSGYTINNLKFINNTIYAGSNGAQYGMIFPGERFNNTSIQNNIFVGFTTNPIEVEGANKTNFTVENNIFYGNGTNAVNLTGSTPSGYINRNNLTSNPLFTSAGTNFTLQATSPAINSGVDVGYTMDYLGNAVPFNSVVDRGAYEYGSSPANPGTEANITAFTISGQVGSSVINTSNRTIAVTMPFGASRTSLSPIITLSTGATINPGSGVARNFTTAQTYTVTAQDNTTQATWTVTVTNAANTATTITGFTISGQVGSSVINTTNRTVSVTMPNGTSRTSLSPTITLSTGATINPASGVARNFTTAQTYTVTAQNNTTQATWTVTVSNAASTATTITGFTIPGQVGSSVINTTNRTVSVAMPFGTSLTSLTPTIALATGATINPASGVARNFSTAQTYTVTAQDNTTQATWTVSVTTAANTATAITGFTIPGQIGSSIINAANRTVAVTMPVGTVLTSLTPTISLSIGATINPGSGVARNFSAAQTYTVTAQDNTTQTTWTITVTSTLNTDTDITGFTFSGISSNSTINTSNRTVNVTVPFGTSITSLSPVISLSNGASINPASGVARNFSTTQSYTVTAQDNTTQAAWTINVNIETNNAANIISFAVPGQLGQSEINSSTRNVRVTMPYGSNVSALTPSIGLSTGASINPGSGVARNFTTAQSYTVTAQDNVSQRNWTVSVIVSDPVFIENNLPEIDISYEPTAFKGFLYAIDASNSFDKDNEPLSYKWNVPTGISTSSKNEPLLLILPEDNISEKVYSLELRVSDGKDTVKNKFNIGVYKYNPDAIEQNIVSLEASGYDQGNTPENIIDNNPSTSWSVEGDNQWMEFTLEREALISHFELAFNGIDNKNAYFDIFASSDKKNWELLLDNSSSCGFTPNMHAFSIPETKASQTYKFVKLIGHMNSANTLNSFSEFKVFGYNGTSASEPAKIEQEIIEVYPNPAVEEVYVKATSESYIRVFDINGSFLYEQKISEQASRINYNFMPGIYMVQLIKDDNVKYTQKLVVK